MQVSSTSPKRAASVRSSSLSHHATRTMATPTTSTSGVGNSVTRLHCRKPSTGLAVPMPSARAGSSSASFGPGHAKVPLPHWPTTGTRRSRFTASAFILLALHLLIAWRSWGSEGGGSHASDDYRLPRDGQDGHAGSWYGGKRGRTDGNGTASPGGRWRETGFAQQFLPAALRDAGSYWPGDTLTSAFRKSTYLRRRKVSLPFDLSPEPLPVHHVHEQIHFHNTPVSKHRPASNQFVRAKDSLTHMQGGAPPVISIITATQNPRPVMLDTARSVLGQSLQNLEWIIVNDHTTSLDSLDLLREIAKDPRVVVIENNGEKGLSASRNVALRYLLGDDRRKKGTIPKYLASLDDDDLYEFTALEKVRSFVFASGPQPAVDIRGLCPPRQVVWMLESNPAWDLGGFYVIKFAASNETVTSGLHSGAANFFSVSSLLRLKPRAAAT